MIFRQITFFLGIAISFALTGCAERNDTDSVYGQWIADGFLPVSIHGLNKLELEIQESGEILLIATFVINGEESKETQRGNIRGNRIYIKGGSAELIRDGELLNMIDPKTREITVFRRQ